MMTALTSLHAPARRRVAALSAGGLAALALTAAAPPRAHAMDIAIQDESVLLTHAYYQPVSRAYSQAKQFGARWVRFNLLWGDFKRHGYGRWDRAVNEARANGFKVQLTVAGTPQYDPHGDRFLSFKNPNANRYAKWAKEVARHFKGRVFRYSVWNEPNLPRWITSRNAPATYRALLQKGYAAFKSVDRRNQVLMGELTSAHNPLRFITLVARGHVVADGLAYHPFQFGVEPGKRDRKFVGISNTPKITSLLRSLARQRRLTTSRRNRTALGLYFTEFGYQGPGGGVYAMSESKRVKWTVEAFKLVKRYGAREMLYYQLVHSPPGTLRGDIWDSGIVNLNGSPTNVFKALVRNRRSFR